MKKNIDLTGDAKIPRLKKLFMAMRLTVFMILISVVSVFASKTYSQSRNLNIKMDKVTLKEVLSEIEDQSNFIFMYSGDVMDINRQVSIDAKNENINDILETLFEGTLVRYTIKDRIIVLSTSEEDSEFLSVQNKPVSGKVIDASASPLPGVTVLIKGTMKGTITNDEGNYSIADVSSEDVLVFSFVGMSTLEIPVARKTVIDVTMEEDAIGIEEVVAIGYGTAKKKDLTGAIASVNLKLTRDLPNINAAQSIRGTVAGVTVTETGRPGAEPRIQIRGTNSISASNDPLIVLDGVIYRGGNFNDINPGDIESIHILKDASSTAIYGSLAANGVIEITTKRGTTKKPTLSFNSYYGVSDYAHLPRYLNAEEYLAQRLDAEAADGGPHPFSSVEQDNIDAGRTIDPFEAISQNAPIYNGELSISGKTDDFNYLISGSYLNSKSPVAGDNFSRVSGRINLNVKVNNWISAGLNSGYSVRDDAGYRANLSAATYLSPYATLFYDDGVPRMQPMDMSLVANPIFNNEWKDIERKTKTLFLNGYTDIVLPLKGLAYRLNVGYTEGDRKDFQYSPAYDRDGFSSLGNGSKTYAESKNVTLEHILKYSKVIEDHTFKATAMYGFYESKDESSNLSSKNIFNDALGWNSLQIGDSYAIETAAGKDQQTSAMGRIGYIYKGKYILDASIRRDGYSAFGEGRKYGVFPAVGMSWNVIEENFMSPITFLDNLKLRLSWGKNGNRGVGRYSSLSNVDGTFYVLGPNSVVGQYITSMANPNLGWETTTSTNFAVEFSVLKHRINGSVDVYKSHTSDLLLRQSIPNTNGFRNFLRNIGEVENKGIEISLNTVNVRAGDFTWSTDFAFTHNKNKIVSLTGQDVDGDGIEDDDIASRWFIGESLGTNYDYVFDGIYQEGDDLSLIPGAKPGDMKFKDISGPEGIPDGVISPAYDRTVLHNDRPNFTLGVTNSFSFKGVTLMAVVTHRNGGYSRNTNANPGTDFYYSANYLKVPYWTPENPINTHPAINYKNPLGYGFYASRTYTRLQDVSVSYTIPKRLISKFGVDNLQVYASGKNLATWTKWIGWDPEYGSGARDPGSNGPLMKIFTFGFKVQL